jgi:hypothetical protein
MERPPSLLDLLNLFGFSVGSISLTIAIFYGFFVNIHNKNLDQSNKFAKAINTLYAEIKDHHDQLRKLQGHMESLQGKIDCLLDTQNLTHE